MSAAGDVVAVDAKVLANAKVDRNGKQVGSVKRVMVRRLPLLLAICIEPIWNAPYG